MSWESQRKHHVHMEVDKDNILVVFENNMYSRPNDIQFYNSHQCDHLKPHIVQVVSSQVDSISICFDNNLTLNFKLYGSV
jgi:hypothetical protein